MVTVTGSQEVVNLTTNQLAENLGVDYPAAQGLIKVLTSKGVVKIAGQQPPKSGKGKPSTIYAFPRSFSINLGNESHGPLSAEPPPGIAQNYNVEGVPC